MTDEVNQVAAQVEQVAIGDSKPAASLKSKYFDKEQIHKIVYNGVDKTLTGQSYKRENAKQWIEAVTETTMAHLNQYRKVKISHIFMKKTLEIVIFSPFSISNKRKKNSANKLTHLTTIWCQS